MIVLCAGRVFRSLGNWPLERSTKVAIAGREERSESAAFMMRGPFRDCNTPGIETAVSRPYRQFAPFIAQAQAELHMPSRQLVTDQCRCSLSTTQHGSFHCITHQHGNGQRTHSARDGRHGSCHLKHLGVDIADERRSFGGEILFALGVARKELTKCCGIG